MSWYRIDDKSAFHAKVVAAGNAAWGALTRMGAWSSDHLTDGDVPQDVARVIGAPEEIAKLFSVGLLENSDAPTWKIHDFLDWNPSAAKVKTLRKERAKAGRAGANKRHGNQPATPLAIARPVAEQNRAPLPFPIPIPEEGRPAKGLHVGTSEEFVLVEAFCEAIRAISGTPHVLTASFERRDVVALVETYGPKEPKAGERSQWLTKLVAEWVTMFKNDPKAHGGWKPMRLLDWVKMGKPSLSKDGRTEPKPPSPGGMSPRVRRATDEKPVTRALAANLGKALLEKLDVLPHVPGQMLQTSESRAPDTTSRRAEAPESAPSFDLVDSDPAPDFDQRDEDEDWLRSAMGEP